MVISNGYPAGDCVVRQARPPARRWKINPVDGPEKIPFHLPYMSDDMSTAVRRCLRKAGLQNDVGVVEIPSANLKCQLVRIHASWSSVSYYDYTGGTARPLRVRIMEHLGGLAKSKLSTRSEHTVE
ncbi:hypothetical protein RB195_025164 [Necator americanus]|uniref:Uncharacterized protein n=1 Tax=Necator americanus TaxID=51031 RepID=A0ABR1ER56_NECAM